MNLTKFALLVFLAACITTLATIALLKEINGAVAASAFTCLGAIGGFVVARHKRS